MIRVAMPLENDNLSEHFGHASKFAFFEIEDGKITTVEIEPAPEHFEGSFPNWIASKNADVIIVAGIGPKAVEIFESKGIRVITNVVPKDARSIVEDFIANKLDVSYKEVCDHHNH
ncbi:NifB/NifX family molybdenum-iron cluster-binding protein [Hippea jasoniae]|uniref:NifB/NifX family molybdenum-iron cluster-binding protein n=1 Tax=Hippea jasoniae TaxID=944479 RepID=UPI00068C78AF|nr:NifB/NifX family molybdenum-iron cluster-binding protein [Hippea jasoniae]